MKKAVIVLLFLLYGASELYSQIESIPPIAVRAEFQAKQVVPPSPIAAELGKYGNTPVSLFNGTPNISIPIFELKGNQLSLPISLSYDASGFKPQDKATWVGSGWSLNAGGVVTRAVMGNPDMESNYFGASNPLNPPPGLNTFPLQDYMMSIQEGLVETQPDIYYYNFTGHTGKFLIRPDNSIISKKKNMLKIVSSIGSSSKFTITDESGVIYTFSEVENSTIIPSDEEGSPSSTIYEYVSSWFLSNIQTADGTEQIDFEYHGTSIEQDLYVNARNNESHTFQYVRNNLLCPIESTEANSFLPVTSRIKPKFLKKIILKRYGVIVSYVDLNSSLNQREDSNYSQDRLLEEIEVYKMHNSVPIPIKRYGLTYSYFINNNNLFEKKRLRLDELQEHPVTGISAVPPYKFSYNTTVPIPDRFTTSIDHWGFFNNKANPSLVPSVMVPDRLGFPRSVGGNADREPSLEGSSCTMLNKIQYPTGGYSTFVYELNQAIHDFTVYSIGGIRIQRTTDFSFDGKQASSMVYEYLLADGRSSGEIGNLPVYLKETSRTEYYIPHLGPTVPCNDFDKQVKIYTMSANSVFGLGTIQGGHIGYSRVSEKSVDPNNNSLGKTIYNYNIKTDYVDDNDNHIGNGDLIGQAHYRNDDKLLKENIYAYDYGTTETITGYPVKAAGHQTNKTMVCRIPENIYITYGSWEYPPPGCIETRVIPILFFLADYTIRGQYGRLVSRTERIYDQASDSYSSKTVNLEYGSITHNYPTKISQSSVGNTELVTLKKYAADYNLTTWSDIPSTAIRYLQTLNMGGTEIESTQYRQNTDGSNKRYISGKLTTYKLSGVPRPERILELESDVPLLSVQSSTVNNGTFIYDEAYKPSGSFKYSGDNLIEQAKDRGPISSYIWGYDDLQPIASVSNAQSNAIAYTSFETDLSNSWIAEGIAINSSLSLSGKRAGVLIANSKISKLFTSAPEQLLLSYWAREGSANVVGNGSASIPSRFSSSNINGWTYYEHLMPIGTYMLELKAGGGGSTTVDEVRLHPVNAQMETFAYDPHAALNTQVSTSNHVQYYEYDEFGRLHNIRDQEKSIIQSFSYNYGPGIAPESFSQTLFFNMPTQQNFTKQGCPVAIPENILYKVPYGKYAASNQTSADSLAQQDILENGQAYANAVGRCLFYNLAASGQFFKMDCSPDQGLGLRVTYTVPAGKYAVEGSQAKADSLALADVAANGQTYANATGTCSCAAEGQRSVNGVCETGQKIFFSSTPEPPNGWKCVYYYRFSDNTTSIYYTSYSSSQCINL